RFPLRSFFCFLFEDGLAAMKSYLLRRIPYLLPVILGVSIITFGLINLAPGDPAEIILDGLGFCPGKWE
ncbi:MAG: hypothetical protein M0028_01555, partial [Clostridia bacterium]|nr:hypothetical protein [Clostridia bacterium]